MAEDIKRIRYFNGLFLRADDLILEQDYHKRMQRLHNRHLHSEGVMLGLDLELGSQNDRINVKEGLALDRFYDNQFNEEHSREILIETDTEVILNPPYVANDEVYIWVEYSEQSVDVEAEKGGTEFIRIQETGVIKHSTERPLDTSAAILLGKVVLDGAGNISSNSFVFEENGASIRKQAGFSGKELETEKLTLRVPDVQPPWAVLEGRDFGNGDVGLQINSPRSVHTGDLEVQGALKGRVPLGGVIPVFNYGSNIPALTSDETDDGFMLADGQPIPAGTALHDMATANLLPTDRPDLTNDVFIMGATASGTTGGANNITVSVPAHSHDVVPLTVTGVANVGLTGSTGGYIDQGLGSHAHRVDNVVDGTFVIGNVGQPIQTEPNNAVNRNTTGPINSVQHTHSLNTTVSLSGLDVGGSIGSGPDGGTGPISATPFDNRPAYISAVYLIRVN